MIFGGVAFLHLQYLIPAIHPQDNHASHDPHDSGGGDCIPLPEKSLLLFILFFDDGEVKGPGSGNSSKKSQPQFCGFKIIDINLCFFTCLINRTEQISV